MKELTPRQKFLLTLVIHEYIRTAQAVGSHFLVERYRLEMSSATVRNELSALTEAGYLRQLHTSAGRVPTEEGYRFFVSRLVDQTELSDNTRRTISHQFYQTRQDVEQWMRLAASVLANQSRGASVVTSPHPEISRIKHIELIAARGRQVLMVLVLVGGEIHQQMLTLAEPVPQEQLSATAMRLTELTQGKDPETLVHLKAHLNALEQDVVELLIRDLGHSNALVTGEIYLDGLTNVLAEPEFSASDDARRALHLLEERPLLEDLLARTVMSSSVGGVQVLIGGEGTWEDLRQCSVILARYGMPGLATGTLGVLGPMRMPYGRTISTIKFVAGLLSDLVSETLTDG